MSTVLNRKWDSANAKHIYTDCADCSYDECWDAATKTHGVYCDDTFYPRCWDATEKNWKVSVPCCFQIEWIYGNSCCVDGTDRIPKYVYLTVQDVDCGLTYNWYGESIPYTVANGSYILGKSTIGCIWEYSTCYRVTARGTTPETYAILYLLASIQIQNTGTPKKIYVSAYVNFRYSYQYYTYEQAATICNNLGIGKHPSLGGTDPNKYLGIFYEAEGQGLSGDYYWCQQEDPIVLPNSIYHPVSPYPLCPGEGLVSLTP